MRMMTWHGAVGLAAVVLVAMHGVAQVTPPAATPPAAG